MLTKKNKRMVALSMSIAIGVNMIFSGNISSAKEEKHEYQKHKSRNF